MDRRLAHHAAVDPDLVVRRVEPQIRMLAHEAPRAKGFNDGVEIATNPGDLRLRQTVEPQRLDQVVHLPSRHAVDVGFLHHRQ
jgi:hypothetical protein